MDSKKFIQFIRESKEYDMLILRRPTAFVLLSLIAKRAKRSIDHPYPELEMGEALIGDYENYGSTERKYRTDKAFLSTWHFATFRTTNRGTIAKLTNSNLFDINIETDRQTNRQTDRREADEQPTTNNNVKNVNKKKEAPSNSPSKTAVKKDIGAKFSMVPCTYEELREIGLKKNRSIEEVTKVQQLILEKVESGEKKYKTMYHTLLNWVSKPWVPEMTEFERMDLERETPEHQERLKEAIQIVREQDGI